VDEVVLLSLSDGCGDACSSGTSHQPPAPVLACKDALTAEGAAVDLATACSDGEIDEIITTIEGRRLVVAAASVSQLRAVVRRMVRRYAPAPSRRPADLPPHRTIPDLPPIGVLPLYGATILDLPADPSMLAKAVLHAEPSRLDLLRNDGGSVTINGALLGGQRPFQARIEVDDAVLAEPGEPLLACAISNAAGFTDVGGLPLTPSSSPADGLVTVAVALPVVGRHWGRRTTQVEVRRTSGRAVAVSPTGEVPYVDDGVAGTLTRKRSWWTEPGAWGVFRP
jgi:hypothetical protein